MSEVRLVSGAGTGLRIDKDIVFRQIKCERDNPFYEEYEKEYEELLPLALSAVKPRALLGFFLFPDDLKSSVAAGSRVIYLISTVGPEVCGMISEYFKGGDYVRGMLLDAIASAALFSFEKTVFRELRAMCRREHVGISRRYEAPGHVPMEIQRVAFEALKADELLGLKISSGLMYDPVKSTCQVFTVTDDERVMRLTHGCSDCSNTDCPGRQESVTVIVKAADGDYEFSAAKGENLLTFFRDNEIFISAPCGGKGRCGKCAVRVLSGSLDISEADRTHFTQEELDDGKRLACTARIYGDCTIEPLTDGEEDISALGTTGSFLRHKADAVCDNAEGKDYGIAIDIGTTTLAISLTDLKDKHVVDTYTAINRQRSFGADVISRIEAAGNGNAEELKLLIEEDILKGIGALLEKNGIPSGNIRLAGIAGNTTMLHLLQGFPVKSLGVYPFKAHSLSLEKKSFKSIFCKTGAGKLNRELGEVVTYILPGCSAFVGADIVSGLYSLGFQDSSEICALIDLGTNGEMAVGNRKRLLVTSTAAGPAFEGGNIEYGTGSIPGAISSVTIKDGRASCDTIGGRPPAGICGTGVIETVAELLKEGLIDETGMFDEDYFDDGFPLAQKGSGEAIAFTQKDVREIQLAKSAVRAGFEVLLKRFGVRYDELSRLYLAGGFGYYLNVEKASLIGMIPQELVERTEACGNSSLNGVIRFITSENLDEAERTLSSLAEEGEEIALSTDRDFNELYMENMLFL